MHANGTTYARSHALGVVLGRRSQRGRDAGVARVHERARRRRRSLEALARRRGEIGENDDSSLLPLARGANDGGQRVTHKRLAAVAAGSVRGGERGGGVGGGDADDGHVVVETTQSGERTTSGRVAHGGGVGVNARHDVDAIDGGAQETLVLVVLGDGCLLVVVVVVADVVVIVVG